MGASASAAQSPHFGHESYLSQLDADDLAALVVLQLEGRGLQKQKRNQSVNTGVKVRRRAGQP